MTDNRNGSLRKVRRRTRLWTEQGGFCWWCKKPVPLYAATMDHLIPRSKGGTDSLQNNVMACYPCNQDRKNEMAEPKRGWYSGHEWHPEP